ncbi:zinc finger (c3hc4 ring finger) domain-caontaining protein [Cyclospora cayetanensis]|uniref:Zinc finger (C3hc4 ring finger) domain-caontaining protein n=1 Tax=Cyclospora cayetanensis TaxID=88456 RepID=A0A1D3CWY5_9EIME|nr:zinc finger (c3hc4 ring finger) domain-caontaining protein [Cyclospora cayetanensis]
MAFFFSSTRRLYFSVMTYMLTRWMYTDRLDALLGAPSSAVMGPLSKGPPEGQALLMCLAILCAAGLVASISVLSLLKAADLLPSRLLHYTRVLSCTHLLLQEDVKKKSSSRSSAPVEGSRSQGDPIEVSHDDFQPGDATPSSAHSKEQEFCIFCFDDMKPGELLRVVSACQHKFHAACLDVWLFKRLKASCPMCGRFRYPSGMGAI